VASGENEAVPERRRGPTPLVAIALLTLAVVPATLGRASAAAPQPRLSVYFVRGEQLARVARPGTTPAEAMRELVAGPTRAEITLGFRTYLPAGTRVRSVTVANGLATVDLNARFSSGPDADSRLAALSQVVRTLTGVRGADRVRFLTNGKVPAARFPRVSMDRPVTMRLLQTPDVPVPKPPQPKLRPPDPAVRRSQQRLIALGCSAATTTAASGPRRRTRSSPSRSGSGSNGGDSSTRKPTHGSRPPRTRLR
jgi:hypothetical protein